MFVVKVGGYIFGEIVSWDIKLFKDVICVEFLRNFVCELICEDYKFCEVCNDSDFRGDLFFEIIIIEM